MTDEDETLNNEPVVVGGRGRILSKRRGRGRGRSGGTFLAEISVPVALLAGVQYMKNRKGHSTGKRRKSRKNYRKNSLRRRRR